ncbi:uncharacterized protein BXIN_3052 [Babesia sp. Xinjiang]|uniref:uncharacterized protein n=1 Tax=Babesia sp. Xinjiang TaxID=462227 RepID=UPI000A2277B8|nr:uncharacterized protein BXIN_3052 [Babesia sp. Xinjiang]ORM39382.1 hypothetical protein BXIN_3052 [Babesia sp. Xinjiang]
MGRLHITGCPGDALVAATAANNYRKHCFIPVHRPVISSVGMKIHSSDAYEKAPTVKIDIEEDLPKDPTAGDASLYQWKCDMADIPGAWHIYYPLSLKDTVGLSPNAGLRPSVLFCDISGSVTGPQHPDSGKGAFVLDAGESVDVDDSESYVHNRRLAMIMLSGKNYSNIRLVLLGRIFYSKNYVLNELNGLVQMRAAMFIGQAFVETYLDSEGNEVDPLTWEYQALNERGSPFRWMHGNDKWKLLGPFTSYRVLGPDVKVPHRPMIFDNYSDLEIYNMVDPLKLNKTPFTQLDKVEQETKRVIDAVFEPSDDPKKQFQVPQTYVNEFYQEMVELAKEGPQYYKDVME